MDELTLQTTLLTMSPSVEQALRALLLSAALGVGTSLLYRLTQAGRVTAPTLQRSLVLLCMISALVMMVVGNNVARAFSLVGALSIIRFRTRLRTSWDISFVFLSMALGIGCGVFAWKVALAGAAVIGLAVVAVALLPAGFGAAEVHLLRCDLGTYEGVEGRVSELLAAHLERRSLEEAQSQRFGETMSYRYRVVLKRGHSVEQLLRELSQVEGVERVVLYSREEVDEEDD